MVVHPQASAFDNVATEYEQGRPGYPRSLLDWVMERGALAPGSTVVDLAAGTGKLTRLLVESGARVIGVEPLAAMREEFRRILPDVEILDAAAESIPLPDGCADVLTCGMAIHWFANTVALAEIARVLRDGGEFVIAMNGHDKTNPVQRRISEIRRIAEAEGGEVTPGGDWRSVVLADPHFELIGQVTLANHHVIDRAGLLGRVRSSSPVARLPEARRAELLAGLDELVEGDSVDLTPITEVVALRKVAAAPAPG
ncbi:MAG TPA: class I SAM-dependent methyltransferase [Acidimicrobiales bacterium]|nr:class I SAM-dependent methyltransferase [Acidimicrobiales bacterium]